MQRISIPRVPRSEFRAPRWGGEPRVVLDNVPDWPTHDRWQPEYLKSVGAEHTITVRKTNGSPQNFLQNLAGGGKISLAEYIDWVIDTAHLLEHVAETRTELPDIARAVCDMGFEASYYLSASLSSVPTALTDGVAPPRWYQKEPTQGIMWCGVLGTSSGLHFDGAPNCNVQLVGRKHFILFPPSQSRLLYQRPGTAQCRFDPAVPDFDRFPEARNSTAWHCTLAPGESLFIPVGWYHQVTVVSPWALNINFFWERSPLEYFGAANVRQLFVFERGRAILRRGLDPRRATWLGAHRRRTGAREAANGLEAQ
jgi:hypothetical protein